MDITESIFTIINNRELGNNFDFNILNYDLSDKEYKFNISNFKKLRIVNLNPKTLVTDKN